MTKAATIMGREASALFVSTTFWVLAAGFMAFLGLVFGLYVSGTAGQTAQADMGPILSLVGTIMLFVTPLLSMRLLAEETRSGTLELLMTSPVRDWQVVVGKWLGAFAAYCVMIGLTVFYLGIMVRMATSGIAQGPLAASYLGVFLLGAALLAVGTLTSSLSENQVVAAFLGIMAVMVLWFLPLIGDMMPDSQIAGAIAAFGLSDHFANFGQGLVDSRDVLYFLSITAGALYLAVRMLESRRWR